MAIYIDMKDWNGDVPFWWQSFYWHVRQKLLIKDDIDYHLSMALKPFNGVVHTCVHDDYYKIEFETEEDYEYFKIKSALGWNNELHS